jgi:hypothetical protein
MKMVRGMGVLALTLSSLVASWVLLAPDTGPGAAAAQPARPATGQDGQGFSVLAWPQPAPAAQTATPAQPAPAAVTATAQRRESDEEKQAMEQDAEDDEDAGEAEDAGDGAHAP